MLVSLTKKMLLSGIEMRIMIKRFTYLLMNR